MSPPKPDGRPNFPRKTREEIKAEREAKKAAKAAAKAAKLTADKADSVKSPAPVANRKVPVRDVKTDDKATECSKVEIDDIKSEVLEKSIKSEATNSVNSQPSQEPLTENAIQSSSIVQNGASENTQLGELIFFSN
jgi:hypothetical protein